MNKIIDIRKISILAIYLSILISIKYILGIIVGVEIITSMFIFAAMVFELPLLILLSITFSLLNIVIYGFGFWFFVYVPLWTGMVTLTYFLKPFLNKHVLIYALYNGLWAFSLFGWFFFSDWIMLGLSGAIGMVFTGMMVNMVGAIVNIALSLSLFWFIPNFKKIYMNVTNNRY